MSKFAGVLLTVAALAAAGFASCQAHDFKPKQKGKAAAVHGIKGSSGTPDLKSPAMNFSGVAPVTDVANPNLAPPKKDGSEYLNQTDH